MWKYRASEWWISNENEKITANSMQEATIQIRQQLGKDAVILNSKTVVKRKLFGLKKQQMVEVIAVLDQDFEERAGKGLQPAAAPIPVLPKRSRLNTLHKSCRLLLKQSKQRLLILSL